MKKKAKAKTKTLKQFLIVMAATASVLLSIALPVAAQEPSSTPPATRLFPLPGAEQYGSNIPDPKGVTAQAQFQELMWGLVQNVRFILGAVAIAMIVYSGFSMVIGWGNEEVYTKQRTTLFYAVIGLAVVGMAGEGARIFSVSCPDYTPPGQPSIPCTPGGFLKDPNALVRTTTLFNQRTQILITFIKYFVGSVAVLMIVRNGLRMITMGSSEEKIALDKKNLVYSILGLGFIIMADTAISQVFYKLDISRYPSTGGAQPAIDAARGVQEIVGFTNFVVSIVGPLAILALLAGGVMYMTAGGQEEKMGRAKRLIIAALAGIVIIYGAFAVVSTFIAGRFPQPPPAT